MGFNLNTTIHKSTLLKDIRMIAMDLDGTVLLPDKTISQRTREALYLAADAGIEIVPVSGRPFLALPECICALPFIRYAGTSNGVVLNEMPSGKIIRQSILPKDNVRRLLDALPECCVMEASVQGTTYMDSRILADPVRYGLDDTGIRYIKKSRISCADMRNFVEQNIDRLDCIDLILENPREGEQIRKTLRDRVPGLYITSSTPHLLEISAAEGGKRQALKWLEEILGIPASQVLAFGDSENDIEMLEYAGIGAAMENGDERLKAAADIVAAANTQDGAAEVIEQLLFSEGDGHGR